MNLILLIISICSFLFYGVVGKDKALLIAPVIFAIFVVVAVALVKRALALGRKGAGESAPSIPVAGVLWSVFVLYGLGLIPQSVVPFESKLRVLTVAGAVGAYLVWGGALGSFRVSKPVLGLLIFVVMLAALYGLIIHFKNPDSILWTQRYTDAYEGRLRSTYICPNHFAHLLQMLLPFCLVLLFIPRSGLYLRLLSGYSLLIFVPPLFLTESRAGWLGSIAAIGVTCLLLALRKSKKLFFILLILVPLCSALLLVGAWRFSETFQRRMQPVVTFLEGQAEEGIGSESRDFRPQTWMDTIDMIKEQPLLGYGPGSYRYAYPEFRKRLQANRIVTGHPHNEYLELIADYGLIGFGLFGVAWLYGLIRILIFSLKTDNAQQAFLAFAFLGTAAGTMVHSFFDFQMHILPNALVFALLAAIAAGPMVKRALGGGRKAVGDEGEELVGRKAVGPEAFGGGRAASGGRETKYQKIPVRGAGSRRQPDVDRQDAPSPAPNAERPFKETLVLVLNKITLWLFAIGFLIGTVFCGQVMGSSYTRALGDRAVAHKDLEQAERYYALAAKLDSSNWRISKSQGQLAYDARYYCLDPEEKKELAAQEETYFAAAYAANPLDPEIINGLAQVALFRGETDAGLELLREACVYRRFNDKYWWNLGVALRKEERFDEALEVFDHARKLKNSTTIKANIRWIKQQQSEGPVEKQPQETNVKQKKAVWPSVPAEQQSDELNDLFDLMQ